MKHYTIVRKPAPMDWTQVDELEMDVQLWRPAVEIRAFAQICYDDAALYVRLRARERDIRREESGALGMPCEDSCLEFFFSPKAGDARYFNIEFNPNGCMYLGFGDEGKPLVRLLPESQPFAPEIALTEDGWTLCYRVPFDFIRRFFPDFSPKCGDAMRANCYKCGDRTVHEHYMCWNPVTSDTPNFHRPCDFGLMCFG